jgi:hypothetical protein
MYTALSAIIDDKFIIEEYGGKMKVNEIRGKPCHIKKEGDAASPPMLSGMTVSPTMFEKKLCSEVYFYEKS